MECFSNYFQAYRQTQLAVEINHLKVDNNNNLNSSNSNQVK